MSAQNMMEAVDRLTLAIATAAQELDGIESEILALDGETCTGTVHWRTPPDGSELMYANHRHNQTCPLHGSPRQNSRLRVYVGKEPDRQAQVQHAMELHHTLNQLQSRQRHLTSALRSDYRIDQITRTLS
ncbi:hypothetical protein ES705_34415 [subsurface metagenome]